MRAQNPWGRGGGSRGGGEVWFGLVWFGMHPARGSVRRLGARLKAWGAVSSLAHRHRAGSPRAHPQSTPDTASRRPYQLFSMNALTMLAHLLDSTPCRVGGMYT